jgi:glycosyltransferase involved in cell wall biosynthesis
MADSPKPSLLILSPHSWFDVWQRPHHLAARFARSAEVAYVAPRWWRQALCAPRVWLRARNSLAPGGIRLRSPLVYNGERKIGLLKRINAGKVAAAARAAWSDSKSPRRVLWIYDPRHAELADHLNPDLVVYDIMDDFTAFPWSPPEVEALESRLLARADLVFAGTRALHESRKDRAKEIHCEISGVEPEKFSPPGRKPMTARARRDAGAGWPWAGAEKVAGFAGTLDGRIDVKGLLEAARRLPQWAFALIGPKTAAFPELERLANAHFTGQIAYEKLPDAYRSWDVGMIPFASGPATASLNPTKTLEYFAAGLPTVSSGIPDLLHYYPDEIEFYGEPASLSLADALAKADESDSVERFERRLALADERSWDAIAGRMWAKVELKLNARPV